MRHVDAQLNQPSLLKQLTVFTRKDLGKAHSILQNVTITLDVYQVCHSVGRCVNSVSWIVLHQAQEWKSMDSIAGISCYLNEYCMLL